MTQFVNSDDIATFTGKKRYSAQARWLAEHHITFMQRDDGSIILRQDELDRHTLSSSKSEKRPANDWRRNLAAMGD